MFVQKSGFEKPTVRLFLTVLILVAFSGLVIAQDAATAPPAATKPEPPSQASTGVRPDAYVIGAEDVTVHLCLERAGDVEERAGSA